MNANSTPFNFTGKLLLLLLISGFTLNANATHRCKHGKGKISVVPNSASEAIIVKGLKCKMQFIVTDADGKIIKEQKSVSSVAHVELKGLPEGLYFVQVSKIK